MLFALKKIHPIFTRMNVSPISAIWMIFGNFINFVNSYALFLIGLMIIPDINNNPWNAPQSTNVQFAPCHNPLTRKTMNKFRYHRGTGTLFPPKGI